MTEAIQPKSKSLEGITELTLVARIKPGLLPSVDTRTYATRLRILLRTVQTLRVANREFAASRPFVDAVERVETLHTFRLALLEEPEPRLLLAVTFDRPWEPYIRIIHRDLGPLLDVIFCNTEGYPVSTEHGWDDYAAWIRAAQIPTEFFYTAGATTVTDLQYLRQTLADEQRRWLGAERCPVAHGRGDRDAHAEHPSDPGSDPRTTIRRAPGPDDQALTLAQFEALPIDRQREVLTQGYGALAGLHRLTELYGAPADGPSGSDGRVLRRTARELLRSFLPILASPTAARLTPPDARYREWADWVLGSDAPPAAAPLSDATPALGPPRLQPGILAPSRDDATIGCVLLLAVQQPAAAAALLERLADASPEHQDQDLADTSIAFTPEGLRRLGLGEAALKAFPQEFLEGMEARAGLLGDVRINHPRNWPLPRRHGAGRGERLQLGSVHAVLQLRGAPAELPVPARRLDSFDPQHPLHALWQRLNADGGFTLLAAEPMRRARSPAGEVREHFGFVDGKSQPIPVERPAPVADGGYTDEVPLGDVLLGRVSSLDPVAPQVSALLQDGSFLVVRKLRQNVAALEAFAQAHADIAGAADALKAEMMGRTLNGQVLQIPAPKGNDFRFRDADGSMCPLQSHVRRTNPRTDPRDGTAAHPVPRILRRGMSYGPRVGEHDAPADAERGLVFMAYNARIAEQFEVVQRWVSGSNPTGLHSSLSDPFLGLPTPGQPRTFQFHDVRGELRTVDLNSAAAPFVTLEWGGYYFVPALAGLQALAALARQAATSPAKAATGSAAAEQGALVIARLKGLERAVGAAAAESWKLALEDFSSRRAGIAAQIWAAVRERHGGVLRTAYGVLVADADQVAAVYANAQGHYSVCGYMDRMKQSFGEIFLGMDEGPAYHRAADSVTAAIQQITLAQAHGLTRTIAGRVLDGHLALSQGLSESPLDLKWYAETVLAKLCQVWFGIADDAEDGFAHGGWSWSTPAAELRCPGHFAAPSRYIFQPNPGDTAAAVGQQHGAQARERMTAVVRRLRQAAAASTAAASTTAASPGASPTVPPVVATILATEADDDAAGRTLIGVLMGFLPTVHGNFLATANAWTTDGTFWDLQLALPGPLTAETIEASALYQALVRGMRVTPVPDMVWRTATRRHRLGPVEVEAGDKVVVGINSATLDARVADPAQALRTVFGGTRGTGGTGGTGGPLHACPGFAMAMGVLVGLHEALLARPQLRPNPGALAVTVKPG